MGLNMNLTIILLVLALFGGAAVYIKILRTDISLLQAEKDTLVTQLDASKGSIARLQASLDEQNALIEKMKLESDARLKANQVALNKARALAATYRNQALELLKRPKPPNVPACDAANNLINEEIRNAK